MKFRLLFPLLIAGLLFTGCGQAKEPNEEQIEGMTEDLKSDSSVNTTEDGEAEQSPYILTFDATTTDGEALTSDCLAQSKLTMINIWATYCNPCLSEMPDLGELAASYDAADFQMLGIVSDVMEDADEADIAYAQELITETGADYSHLLLNESLYVNLVGAVDAVPTTFFVNQEGEVLGYVVGAQTKEVWEELINELLAESK